MSLILKESFGVSMFKFLFAYLKDPLAVGSLHPSSSHLGKALAMQLNKLETVDIVQLGGGTGAITKFLPKNKLTVVEIDRDLTLHLKRNFPDLKIVCSCGINHLRERTTPFGCVVNIPLINNPSKIDLINQLSKQYKSGLLKWCVIYTYGNRSPLDAVGFNYQFRGKKVWKNLPPATVWTYY